MVATDPFNLERFIMAQEPVWGTVKQELQAGRKQSHWMWFVFPQLAALGRSSMAKHYGLEGMREAKAYLAHGVLGARLRHACELLLQLEGRTASEIFGAVDAMKLRSSLTLFSAVAPNDELFSQCLRHYFDGEKDPLTVDRIG